MSEKADNIINMIQNMSKMKEEKESKTIEQTSILLGDLKKLLTNNLSLKKDDNTDSLCFDYNNYSMNMFRDENYILFVCYPSNFNNYDDFIKCLNNNSNLASIPSYLKTIHLVGGTSDADFQDEITCYLKIINEGSTSFIDVSNIDISNKEQIKNLDEKNVNALYSLMSIIYDPIKFLKKNGIKKYSDKYFLLDSVKTFSLPNVTAFCY